MKIMKKVFADTNIFGIAVDRDDSRRESVWRTLERVASGEVELHTAQIVVEEIKQNPHKPTREKELNLVKNLTTKIHDMDKKAEDLANKILNHTGLDVVDSQIVALAILNGLILWSGDRYILREKVINEIKEVLKTHSEYTFKHKKE
ncbi:putative nucleic acid-binding protein, contains PIN domain [Candidatus Methanophagaceae archaeon]|nr:putative nucleic acid-binding protein, contains PIN domain [Methanophagales archaeon]